MIYSIVILYNPDVKDDEYYNIVDNSDYTYFVDNSMDDNLNLFKGYDANKFAYIGLKDNLGIATAQNVALMEILKNSTCDTDEVIFFDQDSRVNKNFINDLSKSYRTLNHLNICAGLLGPLPFNKNTGESYPVKSKVSERVINQLPNNYVALDCLISSGSITSVGVIKKCGLMKDELFIDSVDHEWSWRVLSHGFINLLDTNISMGHLFGDGDIQFLGINIRKGSPIRYYYSFRNWFYLFRLEYVPFKYKVNTLIKMPLKFIVYLYVFDRKLIRFKYMSKGIFHGIINRLGRY